MTAQKSMHLSSELKSYLHAKIPRIEERLSSLLFPPSEHHKVLYQAAAHSLLSPGKRLRPILTIAAAEMLGAKEEAALIPACAIEMVHTYSLIHDDLPCMDDDDFRRGIPTLHKAYSESTAILAGDFLLTYAFQLLSETPGLTDSQKLAMISLLASSAGGEGMIAGQIMDIEAENRSITPEQLQNIHIKKTALLIAAALEIGAIIAGASDEIRSKLNEFGMKVGLAFQIRDDILDRTDSVAKHGKKESSDRENNKSTYVSLYGINEARNLAQEQIREASNILKGIPGDPTILNQLAGSILN